MNPGEPTPTYLNPRTPARCTEAPDKVPEKTNNPFPRRVCVFETCELAGTNTTAVVFGWAAVQTV